MKALAVIALLVAGGAATLAQPQAQDKPKPKRVEVVITDQGFSPDSLEVAAGVPIELVFTRKSDKSCATEIEVPSLKFKKPLPLNEPVSVELTPAKGSIAFGCGMGMLKGKLVVK